MSHLISGTSSGLGAYLHERFGGDTYNRNKRSVSQMGYDTIIHCAMPRPQFVGASGVEDFFHDSVELTRRLLNIPHRRFVYISTLDIYPRALDPEYAAWSESDEVNARDIVGIYAMAKYWCEALVRLAGRRSAILRCGAMLGETMKENGVVRLLRGKPVGLHPTSSFNFILHEDIGDLIAAGAEGTINTCSAEPTWLSQIAEHLKLPDPEWGAYAYRAPMVRNDQAISLVPGLARSSLETLLNFAKRPSLP